ncbi:glycosyltransferase family 2 protein [Psychrobacter frigidicola]|uniref:Glycosyltransferase family 2 protein n=1 Tax=Psychrobacter frigidicola TaxID=45611 RepID=A0A5C7A583_9GAMM|nr:glycosyltransferase family 2 protein [Psychrobacter frigidicola]TXD98432.1 glycosyltransferase family 2 protein [Psychrobacter frigidicola]
MTLATEKPTIGSVIIPVSVITTCYGRNRHLYNLLSSLMHGSVRPAEVIIVNDDADSEQLAMFALNIVQIPTTASALSESSTQPVNSSFDIGRNRNVGAAHASNNALIFLDVDCIVEPSFVEQLASKLQAHPNALLMGQPRYLTRPLTDSEGEQLQQGALSKVSLDKLSVYNPYRYNFDTNTEASIEENEEEVMKTAEKTHKQTQIEQTQDYGAFWSLCFAISRGQFERIGGFDTQYVGYGAEDTDFSFTARSLNIDFYLTNDVIYHQQHDVYRPPLNHLESIVINANRFYDKWQHWPMAGWLLAFADMGLIDWQVDQQQLISMIRKPSATQIEKAHYPDAPYV